MLEELTVKGFGIIQEINWRPSGGLNIITGETGAGKSLVVDAVEALLSGQVKEEDIRHGSDEARVEGVFRLSGVREAGPLKKLLEDRGLEEADDTVLLTCDFRRKGRTTPRVNGQAVPRSLLREIGSAMVDIHGQSDHLSLLDRDHHLDFLDGYARTTGLRHEFSQKTTKLHQIEREIEALSRSEQDLAYRTELLNFQINEIKKAGVKEGEEEELQKEMVLLTSTEKLKAASFEIYRIIYGDESAAGSASAVDRVGEALPLLKNMVDADASLQTQLGRLEEALYGLEEMAREIRSYGDNLNYDPQRLEEVQERLELLRSLKRKYGGSVSNVLAYLEKAEAELSGLSTSGERREQLESEKFELKKEMGGLASKLSQARQKAARKLAAAVKKELADLSMARVDFDVAVRQEASSAGIPFPDGTCYRSDATGADDVVFMASTNPGEPPKPLEKIASTGEISRFLLALKGALAEADTIPVLIFDEIDIGIGGRSGEVIGRKLWNLSRSHQVICVTHLPQIAAFADAHYNVSKRAAGDRTVSDIEALRDEARFNEIAVMLGGARYTASAMAAARELIEKAESWKRDSDRK
jgi:DNA repair protein RecN (Recombination protein N)